MLVNELTVVRSGMLDVLSSLIFDILLTFLVRNTRLLDVFLSVETNVGFFLLNGKSFFKRRGGRGTEAGIYTVLKH
ncbi:hypothetical protein OKW09_001579 [Pseudomonas rhodesiae]|nr:hypothetical protein [Pseudomonas rhodesiae]MDF9769294.1 hypothetical protein [Pseudomonas rhodesiae]